MTKGCRVLTIALLMLILSLALIPAQLTSAADIFSEPFDDSSLFTTSTSFFSDGGGDYFGLTDGATGDFGVGAFPSALKLYTGFTGNFLTGMDLDGEDATVPITVDWNGIDISGIPALSFSGDFAEFFDDPGDIDEPDFILVEYQIDGGGYQNLLQFSAADLSSPPYNGIFREDTDFDGTGDGEALGNAAQTFVKPITGSGTTLDLRLTVSVDSGDEDFAVDNFIISDGVITDTGQPLPLVEGFDDCTLTGWEIISVDADTANTWACSETYSNIEANGYGDTEPANEWLITPSLNLDAQDGDTLAFRSYTNYTDSGLPYPQLQVLYSTDYDGGGDPSIATWTALTGITFSPEDSGAWTDSGDVDLSSISGTNVYIAFQYQSSGTGGGSASTWQLDGINIFVSSVYTPIYDIQYTTDPSGDSPLMDQADVTAEGVVTAVFQYGYFIQDGTGPWNGLWVHDDVNAPVLGDRLRLTGTVLEYYNLTELDELTDYQVLSSGNLLPVPVVLSTAAANDEQYEGVLIQVENVTVSAEEDSNGEWTVDDGSGPLVVDNIGTDTYTPVLNDAITAIVGPLNFSYSAFKIAPRDDGDIILPAPPPAIVINEIHADPDSVLGDANSDGVSQYSDDEFIELVNNSDADVDISSWTVSDAVGVRHTFPEGTIVSANCNIVIFGGGTPTGEFGGAIVQTASSGALGLNNSGDTITINDGATDQIQVAYGSEGGDNQSLTLDPDVIGEAYVKHSEAGTSGGTLFSPGTLADGSQFAGCPIIFGACGDPATFVHDVQGDDASSPLNGAEGVIIEGIVVGDFQDVSTQLRGFFLQEEDADFDADSATSEGIFVYDYGFMDVNVGDVVRVMGSITEYYDLTEMNYVTNLAICGTGTATAATVTLPVASLDEWEHYEGMLVTIPQTLYATENYNLGRYGEVDLSVNGRLDTPTNVALPGADAIALQDLNDRSRIQLEDGSTIQNPVPAPYIGDGNTLRAGDTLPNLTGVLHYGFGVYELHPTQEVIFTRENVREATPPDVGGSVQVASFNVLNYFTTLDGSGPICGPASDQDCRGADTPEEFTRQRAKIVNAIVSMDADVIGLMEIENHPTDDALQNLVDGLNDLAGTGTYDFIPTGPVGDDAIKVALIYKPGSVTPLGAYAVLDSTVDPTFLDTHNRPALAQTFGANATGGIFTVAVNHLKSKGSDCDDIGDPDTGDGQGNCNITRTTAATALVNWLATDPTGSGDPDAIIIGDLNAYAMEDPITAIKAGGYTNLIDAYLGAGAYSYVFYGQKGYLDHALSNVDLTSQISGVTTWHINTDEPAALDYNDYNQPDLYSTEPYRASDHDPVIIGLDVCDEIAPTMDIKLNKDTLWPANHKYVTVHAKVTANDNFDPAPTITLISVTSNEPDNGTGDGATTNDIVILNDFTFKLRAERSALGDERVYTITYQVTDACGNSSIETATVTVPHNQ